MKKLGLVLGPVIGLVFLLAACRDDDATSTPLPTVEPTATPEAMMMMAGDVLLVVLNEQNASGQTGWATLHRQGCPDRGGPDRPTRCTGVRVAAHPLRCVRQRHPWFRYPQAYQHCRGRLGDYRGCISEQPALRRFRHQLPPDGKPGHLHHLRQHPRQLDDDGNTDLGLKVSGDKVGIAT